MKLKALQRDLFRYSSLLTLIIMVWVILFPILFKVQTVAPVDYALLFGGRFFLVAIINIYLLTTAYKHQRNVSAKTRRFIRYLIGCIIAVLLFVVTAPLEALFPQVEDWSKHLLGNGMQGLASNLLIIVLQNFIILQHEKMNMEVENSLLRATNLESANLLLKQQIHPHFLFNALSMLKSLYKTDVRAGETYLSHLVNFLRASLNDSQSKVSRLQDEINLCNDYIEMQQIRFDKALLCSIAIPEQVLAQGAVPSFSIQSLVENAIKHNEVTELSPLQINIFCKDERIIVQNNLQVKLCTEASSGKGLINLIERYRLLSDEEVIIKQDDHTFSVSIKVLPQ